jgi:hypothetical protein
VKGRAVGFIFAMPVGELILDMKIDSAPEILKPEAATLQSQACSIMPLLAATKLMRKFL